MAGKGGGEEADMQERAVLHYSLLLRTHGRKQQGTEHTQAHREEGLMVQSLGLGVEELEGKEAGTFLMYLLASCVTFLKSCSTAPPQTAVETNP